MVFSLICLAGILTVICAPGLIAQARADRNANANEVA